MKLSHYRDIDQKVQSELIELRRSFYRPETKSAKLGPADAPQSRGEAERLRGWDASRLAGPEGPASPVNSKASRSLSATSYSVNRHFASATTSKFFQPLKPQTLLVKENTPIA